MNEDDKQASEFFGERVVKAKLHPTVLLNMMGLLKTLQELSQCDSIMGMTEKADLFKTHLEELNKINIMPEDEYQEFLTEAIGVVREQSVEETENPDIKEIDINEHIKH